MELDPNASLDQRRETLKKEVTKILKMDKEWSQNFHDNRFDMNVVYDNKRSKKA